MQYEMRKKTLPDSAYQTTLLLRFQASITKTWNFFRRNVTDSCLFFSPRGHRIEPIVLEGREMAHSSEN